MHDLAQQTLNKVSFWGKENELCFSPEKSEVIVFTWNRKWLLDELYLGDITIKRKDCVKYLGCYLDSKLSWKIHVQEKVRSATNALLTCKRVIGKNRGLNSKAALWIYTAIARHN
ncbi:hypothetical protein JTE90_023938 [Oedothorax gibbosus]|uniref:Reverse transcriptase n=1 Tax=Oedothorax gibbosus TaxID=931172 RepID=A0AAV6UV15_9ARAC|nr:hypothetical protein JTE90_023938 [Oedothorax gibbosus]